MGTKKEEKGIHMRIFVKKLISFSLMLALLTPMMALGSAAAPSAGANAALYEIYGDGMLFQQSVPATVAGTAKNGAAITAVLYDAAGSRIAAGETVASDGVFAVTFDAPAGGFAEYMLEVSADGEPFRTLSGVVFGDLWLAAGQSNMGYPYVQAEGYVSPQACATERKSWVRILLAPDIPLYKGSHDLHPALPQNDIPGSRWVSANDEAAMGCSAVGYWFAADLAERLDVPVGIASLPLGGSSIISWLSRETIEGDADLLAHVKADGFYHALEGFDESGINVFQDMSTLFNQKVAPLQSFHPKGLIWYQGENEVFFGWERGRYSHAFDLMQDSYTAFFGLEAPLPMIVSQLASYHYANNEAVIRRNLEFTAMQQSRPDARAVVTGYDYAPTFYPEAGSIHPMSKEHLGRRMSFAAQGLVYGLHDGAYTAASLKESRVADGGVYVTLNDTGDGLACDGSFLSGFCAAGADGVFVPAEAEIVAPDTVFIHAPGVEEPAAASYACALSNDDANLWATLDGEKTMPVSPFVTEAGEGFRFWQRAPWMDCEAAQSWHNMDRTEYSGYFDTWSAEGAAVAIESGSAFAGDNGLRVSAEKKRFSVSPVLTYERDGKNVRFSDQKQDWSGFSALTVQVRNTGKAPVTVEALRLVNAPATVFTPAVRDTGSKRAVIPADGQWHEIVFDLNALHLGGAETGAVFGSSAIDSVKSVTLQFSCAEKNAALDVDDFRFSTGASAPGFSVNPLYSLLARLIALLKTMVQRFMRTGEC